MSLPLAVDSRDNMRKKTSAHSTVQTYNKDYRFPVHLSPTFEKPVGVTLFGAVGLKEGEDVLGDVFHHPGGES